MLGYFWDNFKYPQVYVLYVMKQNTGADAEQVKVTLPDSAQFVDERLDGCEVSVEYDSNYSDGTVLVEETAEYDKADAWGDGHTSLNVGDRQITNRHVFNMDGRHIGTDPVVTVVMDRDDAIDIITADLQYEVDDAGGDEIYVQAWDGCVIEEQGFIAGTLDVTMKRVCE